MDVCNSRMRRIGAPERERMQCSRIRDRPFTEQQVYFKPAKLLSDADTYVGIVEKPDTMKQCTCRHGKLVKMAQDRL